MPRPPLDKPLLAILLVGALVRACYLLELARSPEVAAPAFDAAFHDFWARALLSGDWSPPAFFPDPQIHTTPFFRPPGYPYFLAGVYALVGGDPLGARAVQMLLGLVNVVLGQRLAHAMFGRTASLVTAAGMACYWSFPYFEGELLAPTLLVTLLLGALLLAARCRERGGLGNAVGLGVLLGLATLTRPNAAVLVPVVWTWLLLLARRGRAPGQLRAALLGLPLAFAATIAPATIRNYVVAGDLVLITANAGVNLYVGNNAQADGHSARIPILGDLTALVGWTCFDQPALVRGVERLEGRSLRASEVSRFFAEQAFAEIAARPGRTLALTARKAALFWGPAEIANNRQLEVARATSPVLWWLPRWPWALSLALLGLGMHARALWRGPRDPRRDLSALLLAVTLAWFASHLPFFVTGRYRAPLAPLLLVFAGAGVAGLWAQLRARRWASTARWTAVWLALLALAHLQLVDYQADRGAWHFQRGEACRRVGDLDAALAEFGLAIERANEPDPLAHNNLGATLLQLGRTPEAIASLSRALQLNPRYVDAHANLAIAYATTGRDGPAREQWAAVLDIDPDNHQAHLQLGALLLRDGRPAAALPHLAVAARPAAADPDAQYLHALALVDSGERGAGMAALTQLLARTDHAAACVALAGLQADDGDRQGAIVLLERALRLDPQQAAARDMLRRLRD